MGSYYSETAVFKLKKLSEGYLFSEYLLLSWI